MVSMKSIGKELKNDNNLRIVNITRDYMVKNLDKLFAIELNWTDIGEEPWKKENFLLDLPLKWELSFAAENGDSIIGYLIGSEYTPKVSRVHKIVVDYLYRGHGIGKQLMEQYFGACLEKDIKYSQLKVFPENKPANEFYIKLGYQKTGEEKGVDNLLRYVYEKKLI